jgi:hypothetical protein
MGLLTHLTLAFQSGGAHDVGGSPIMKPLAFGNSRASTDVGLELGGSAGWRASHVYPACSRERVVQTNSVSEEHRSRVAEAQVNGDSRIELTEHVARIRFRSPNSKLNTRDLRKLGSGAASRQARNRSIDQRDEVLDFLGRLPSPVCSRSSELPRFWSNTSTGLSFDAT